jgi:hypothetical protein
MPSSSDFLKGNPMSTLKPLLLSLVLLFAAAAQAAPSDELIRPIQDRWAEIKYRSPAKQQADLYNELSEKVRQISAANPNFPPALIWEGIVVSSEAGARGGLGGLSLAKDAKKVLEESLKLDEKALSGSAYTSLAALYAKVPGWPLGFGDKKESRGAFPQIPECQSGRDRPELLLRRVPDRPGARRRRPQLSGKSAQGSTPSGTRTGGPGAAPGDSGPVEANCRGIEIIENPAG